MRPQISNPSLDVSEINIPDVMSFSVKFFYNYYVLDERINESTKTPSSPDKSSRYTLLSWQLPKPSVIDSKTTSGNRQDDGTILANVDKIIAEDNYANPDYMSHTFSDITAIVQGAADIENFSRITNSPVESVAKMAKEQLDAILKDSQKLDEDYRSQLPSFAAAYSALSNLPNSSLGLKISDPTGDSLDDTAALKSLSNNLSLNIKFNKKVIPDIFRNVKVANDLKSVQLLNELYASSKNYVKDRSKTLIDPISVQEIYASYDDQSVKYLGYIIERYYSTSDGLVKDRTYFLDGITNSSFYDYQVAYGKSYFYSIRLVASVKVLSYASDEQTPVLSELFFSSKPSLATVECFEYVPPPEPETLGFFYDYSKNNLLITWEAPTNHQGDIVQYQVMRRKSIAHTFELISQYNFDKTYPGPDGNRYTTGEIIDGNNPSAAPSEYASLIKQSDFPVYVHRDEDFTVDAEFFESSTYIYSVCSVDAHGMISNYSTQYQVIFDVYKNKISSKVICDAGSPRPYPNMKLKMDAFKDTVRISGQNNREMHVYFAPDHIRVADERSVIHKVVEAVAPNKPDENPFYVAQMININNQKYQFLKINVKDPDCLTTT